jgi:hypothetical protein
MKNACDTLNGRYFERNEGKQKYRRQFSLQKYRRYFLESVIFHGLRLEVIFVIEILKSIVD